MRLGPGHPFALDLPGVGLGGREMRFHVSAACRHGQRPAGAELDDLDPQHLDPRQERALERGPLLVEPARGRHCLAGVEIDEVGVELRPGATPRLRHGRTHVTVIPA